MNAIMAGEIKNFYQVTGDKAEKFVKGAYHRNAE